MRLQKKKQQQERQEEFYRHQRIKRSSSSVFDYNSCYCIVFMLLAFLSFSKATPTTTLFKRGPCFISFPTATRQHQRQIFKPQLFSTATIENQNMTSSQPTTTTTTPQEKIIQARKVSASVPSLSKCGKRLSQNELVSFPTETVYGLGCHALDKDAIQKVFAAKERPLTDPLIVHVNTYEEARKLWDATATTSVDNKDASLSLEAQALQTLTSAFWPGPLTIVAPAHLPSVPSIIMAGTGYVACRSPAHPIARALIKEAGVPIAAPSANKFGHVSPTRAMHVWDDLKYEDVWIVDPEMTDEEEDENEVDAREEGEDKKRKREENEEEKKGEDTEQQQQEKTKTIVCNVGVESTVVKVEPPSSSSSSSECSKGTITILRHGAISQSDIKSSLGKQNLLQHFDVLSKKQVTRNKSSEQEEEDKIQQKEKEEEETIAHVAPGQTIRHYSPNVLSYMISHARFTSNGNDMNLSSEEVQLISKSVVIDYNGKLKCLKNKALDYRDLSISGDSKEAAASVFEMLRWSECVVGAERVYFPELIVVAPDGGEEVEDDALILAVKDRLTRAASGVVIDTLC